MLLLSLPLFCTTRFSASALHPYSLTLIQHQWEFTFFIFKLGRDFFDFTFFCPPPVILDENLEDDQCAGIDRMEKKNEKNESVPKNVAG